jgi:hypothetical protein
MPQKQPQTAHAYAALPKITDTISLVTPQYGAFKMFNIRIPQRSQGRSGLDYNFYLSLFFKRQL